MESIGVLIGFLSQIDQEEIEEEEMKIPNGSKQANGGNKMFDDLQEDVEVS